MKPEDDEQITYNNPLLPFSEELLDDINERNYSDEALF